MPTTAARPARWTSRPTRSAAFLEEASDRNRSLLLHAVDDCTIEVLLAQMEATGGAQTWSKRRLRNEHGDGLLPDLVPRARKLGVAVVQNPLHFGLGELFLKR